MRFGVLGINHKSASIHLREVLTRALSRLFDRNAIGAYRHRTVLLSTCNRCELYFHHPDLSNQHSLFLQELRREIDGEFEHALYSFFGEECLVHLSKVTAGIDSAFLGESDIQRQVKEAYASTQSWLPHDLHYLFRRSLQNGKKLRTQLKLEQGVPSLPSVVASLCLRYDPPSILIIGNSDIGRKCIKALKRRGMEDVCIATRYPEGIHLPVVDLSTWTQFDVVIATAKTDQPILFPSPCKTKVIFDLGMPRCSDASMEIEVMDIDQLGQLVAQMRQEKLRDVQVGEKMISQIAERQFMLATDLRRAC